MTVVPKLLVLNSGSSSLKFKVFEIIHDSALKVLASGLCERIADPSNSAVHVSVKEHKTTHQEPLRNHQDALSASVKVLHSLFDQRTFDASIRAVGHRVVHGLHFKDALVITESVESVIEEAIPLAPLHNPPAIKGIVAAKKLFNHAMQVAVFDTAFHQTLPHEAYTYALPFKGVRKYGFHGTNHLYMAKTASKYLNKSLDSLNVITCHLGAGASICAVKLGKSIDTSMGTPLGGLIMATRPGDLDPGILLNILQSKEGLTIDELTQVLNKNSGLAALAGVPGGDMRVIEESKEERHRKALEVFIYSLMKYIGSYLAVMNGQVDAIVFSGGIGEHSSTVRRLVCAKFEWIGVKMDEEKNVLARGESIELISSQESSIKVLVVPADEEIEIATQTLNILM